MSRKTHSAVGRKSASRTRRAARRIGGTVKHTVRRHPKLLTKLVHAGGLLLAFNAEIGQAMVDFKSGNWINDPQGSAQRVLYKATGINPNGSIDAGATTVSVVNKVGAVALIKVYGYMRRHFRM